MKIEKYSFGKILIDGIEYKKDILVFPFLIKEWRRKKAHLVQANDLGEAFSYKPKKLIIGTGAFGVMKVDDKVKGKCQELGIKLIIEKTKDACKLNKNTKEVILALHLTC